MTAASAADWSRFARLVATIFAGVVGGLWLFVALVDPYGLVPFSPPIDRPIVDSNQRYTYPRIVRSGRFESLVVGTSTTMLVDPHRLRDLTGERFVNLAMADGRAWEQSRLVRLFLDEVGPPKSLVFGLDGVWCDQRAWDNRITYRGFPEWLWDGDVVEGLGSLLNMRAIEIAGRVVGAWLGLRRADMREDGYDMFVPADATYDPVRARGHIWPGGARAPDPVQPAVALSDTERRALAFPAHDWLEGLLARLPATTRVVLAWMPVHIAAQPVPGSHGAAVEAECKARITAIGAARGAVVIDARRRSEVTTDDTSYWDPLHYRIGIARRIEEALARGLAREPVDETLFVPLTR